MARADGLRWARGSWASEDDAFAAIVGDVRSDRGARRWLERWAATGAFSRGHVLRGFYMDDMIAGGAVAALLARTDGWWGGADVHEDLGGASERREGSGATGGPGAGSGRLADLGGSPTRAGRTRRGSCDIADAADDAGGSGSSDRPARSHATADRHACSCDRGRLASAYWPGADDAEPDHLSRLRADLLSCAARARSVLAFAPGGSLRSREAAVLVCGGVRSLWLVRGRYAPNIGPTWTCCVAFAGAVRAATGSRAGKLVGGGPGAAPLLCGLCGGAPVGDLDEWAVAHPLAGGSWAG